MQTPELPTATGGAAAAVGQAAWGPWAGSTRVTVLNHLHANNHFYLL